MRGRGWARETTSMKGRQRDDREGGSEGESQRETTSVRDNE